MPNLGCGGSVLRVLLSFQYSMVIILVYAGQGGSRDQGEKVRV
jgi:hypothetical protein